MQPLWPWQCCFRLIVPCAYFIYTHAITANIFFTELVCTELWNHLLEEIRSDVENFMKLIGECVRILLESLFYFLALMLFAALVNSVLL